MTRAMLEKRLRELKKTRDELDADAAHWNRIHPDEEPIEGAGQEVNDLIDSIEAGLNNGRNPA